MTAAKLIGPRALQTPSRASYYFKLGAEYLRDVTAEMEFTGGEIDELIEEGYSAMNENSYEVSEEAEELIGAVLIADAEFWGPMGAWLPHVYSVMMRGLEHPIRRKLLRMAGEYTGTLDFDSGLGHIREFLAAYPCVREGFGAPSFTRPMDIGFLDVDPRTGVHGFEARTLLGDAVLHAEWYAWVASRVGVGVDDGLVEEAIKEGVLYFGGEIDEMSPEVKEFQRVLFMDYRWIQGFHDHYNLRSVLFRRAADAIQDVHHNELR